VASGNTKDYYLHYIPRSREVGQSYFTSIFTTLRAILVSFVLVWKVKPDLVLANGPGTCLPICLSAWVLKVIGIIPHCFIALSESYACVYHPSLTTTLLYPFVNVLFVQWTNLLKRYPKAIYSGRIPIDETDPPLRFMKNTGSENKEKDYVLITVGTTLFEELIRAIDNIAFADCLKSLGYRGLHIQYGSSNPPVKIQNAETDTFTCESYPYKEDLSAEISGSSLVIGHAGVGTIFEALEKDKNIVVVPNTKLMNNHQMEISKVMATRGYLVTSTCSTLTTDLKKANFKTMLSFPKNRILGVECSLILKLRL